MFKIQVATDKDVPAIIDIAEQTWWRTYGKILSAKQIRYMLDALYAPETLSRQIRNGNQTYLVLRDEHGAQGFASYGPREDHPELYKIHKLYVLPHNQKKGYGRALVEAIANRLRSQRIGLVDLNVNRFNPARGFYEKLGFRVVREEDVPIGPYWMNDYVMRLQL